MSSLLIVSHVLQWVLIVFVLIAVWALVRQIGLIHRRIAPAGARMSRTGLEIGSKAPAFDLRDLNGREVKGPALNGRATLLVFIAPGCPSCGDLMPAVRSVARSERYDVDLIVLDVQQSDVQRAHEFIREHALQSITYVSSAVAGELFQVASPPYAILLDKNGTVVAKGTVNHLEHLVSLFEADRLGHPSLESYMRSLGKGEEEGQRFAVG